MRGGGAQANLVSRKPYRGVNQLLLPLHGFESPWWLTFKQLDALGARAGDRAVGVHRALVAADRAAVTAFFETAVAAGAEALHEPRVWPEYHEHYFGAFVRDPDGNNVEAVCHRPG